MTGTGRMSWRASGWLWLCVTCLPACPILEGPGRSLESGCGICPPHSSCETTWDEQGTVLVQCIPSHEVDLGLPDTLSESDSFSVDAEESCMVFGCPCQLDTDCSSVHCTAFNGVKVCSLPCPEICLDEVCPDGCPSGASCVEADDNSAACAP